MREPDETWSAWSAEQTDPAAAGPSRPAGRFVQYRVDVVDPRPRAHARARARWRFRYQSGNLPPEITKLDVPDLSTADGTTRQTRLNVKWDVTDPNDDELNYTVQIRKDGWPELDRAERARRSPRRRYAWDTTAVPSGIYRVR